MMKEVSKTNKFRYKNYFDCYLSGKIIDIGCCEDPVSTNA